MVGIRSYGVYIPKYKLPRKAIAEAWDFPKAPGNLTVSNQDEDSVTMGIAAAFEALETANIDPKEIDALYFCTTTQPYVEKQNAATLASVLSLREDCLTADITDSTRAATIALRSAVDSVSAGKAKNVLVVASDKRYAEPLSMYEYQYGDGAAALVVSSDDGIAKINGYHSVNYELVGPWRMEGDLNVKQFEIKVEIAYGYLNNTIKVIKGLMEKFELTPEAVKRAAYYCLDPRSYGRIAGALKLSTKALADNLFLDHGNTGTALAIQILVGALEQKPSLKPDDNVVFANYGDGADAFYLQATDKLRDLVKTHTSLSKKLGKRLQMEKYTDFLKYRYLIKTKKPFTRKSSNVTMWRDGKALNQMLGFKCNKCGVVQYPLLMRSCVECGCQDITIMKLKRTGTIFTYSLDHLVNSEYYQTPVPRCVVDLDDGGRLLLDMTDCNPYDTRVGMPVELTFRKLHEGGGFINYYWKCVPAEEKKPETEVKEA
ncbi:MAG TPA: OB-fold domain-containing protein [Candidatus Deferrimicrobium sp.]|nr:OB-fold domain-containing protein [Candidatus Deferrimicrobium sp.]